MINIAINIATFKLCRPSEDCELRKATIYFAVMILTTLPSLTAQEYVVGDYIPSGLLDDYWAFYGAPYLDAKIIGANQYERGDNVTLFVQLVNAGGRINYESTKIAGTPMEKALSVAEAAMEWDVGHALGITGTLRSSSDMIEVMSGGQVLDNLRALNKSENPMEFVIKIDNHAPAGEYLLELDLDYEYQNNVQVDAVELDPDLGLKDFKVARYHKSANQTIPLKIIVMEMADFDIFGSKAEMKAGQKDEVIEVTYKNMGEDPAKNAIARISLFKPFASDRDQAYIGTLEPGEEKKVTFKVDVDGDATPKPYSINSEIKYTDLDGDTIISDSMKIPVNVGAARGSYLIPILVLLMLLLAGGGYIYRRKKA